MHLTPFALKILREGLHTQNSTYAFTTDGVRPFSGYSKLKVKLDELSA